MTRTLGVTILAAVVAAGMPATAHHSNPYYFEMNATLTLEGEVVRVEWVNPHILLYLRTTDENGEPDTWIVQGTSNVTLARSTLAERLTPGTRIEIRVLPPRRPLRVNDSQTVLPSRPDDAEQSWRIAAGGEIRFANGDRLPFGGGPKF